MEEENIWLTIKIETEMLAKKQTGMWQLLQFLLRYVPAGYKKDNHDLQAMQTRKVVCLSLWGKEKYLKLFRTRHLMLPCMANEWSILS